jgi:hypothetical protein
MLAGINYITGILGAGKSLYAVRQGSKALLSGRVFASNVHLIDGWERRLLRHSPYYLFASAPNKRYMEAEIRTRYHFERDFLKLLSLRLSGHGEARGVRVFDESQDGFNNRDWKDDAQKLMLRRFARARKRGWADYIVSQHAKNTDVAVRRIAATEIRVINWRQHMRIPVLGTPLLPVPVFLAMAFPIEETAVPGVSRLGRAQWREMYTLGYWSKLYDTYDDIEFDDALERDSKTGELIPQTWLPLPVPVDALPPKRRQALEQQLARELSGADLHLNPFGGAPEEMAPHQPQAGAISSALEP